MDEDKSIVPTTTNLASLEIDKSSLCLSADDYSTLTMSPAAQKILSSIVSASHVGLVSAAPLTCQGPGNCPFVTRCPIYRADGKDGQYPIGKQCVAEAAIIQERFVAYADELDRDGKLVNSMTFRSQVSKLVELDLYDYRLSLILGGAGGTSDGSLLIEQTIGIDKASQEEIKQVQDHPAWRMKVKVQQQRMELLDSMGLTERRKAAIDASLHRNSEENFLSKSIELLERIAKIEEAMG